MKNGLQAILAALVVASMSGCASPYLVDRGRDAADVFTLCLGTGSGVGTRVGPVHAGLLYNHDRIGLRGGEFRSRWRSDAYDSPWAVTIDPLIVYPGPDDIILFGADEFEGKRGTNTISRMRGKWYEAEGICPFVMLPVTNTYAFTGSQYPYPYLSQIELSAGLGVSFRLGFNPGELLDFILGWFPIDIYGDDIGTR